jgi:hypothetical protein
MENDTKKEEEESKKKKEKRRRRVSMPVISYECVGRVFDSAFFSSQ